MPQKHSPSRGSESPDVWGVYDEDTGSIQYICACPDTHEAALIDVVQDFHPASASNGWKSAESVLDLVQRENLQVRWIIDTHPHADHLMASCWLAEKTGAPTVIGSKVTDVARIWKDYYGFEIDVAPHFDRFVDEGDELKLGKLTLKAWFSPGHTAASMTFIAGDAAFVHDTLMYPDNGSARADFPGGSVEQLWESISRILTLPGDTRLFVGHDYPTDEREEPRWEATVSDHQAQNAHLAGKSREEFIELRTGRDENLELPDRMLAALQFNLRGGRSPEPGPHGLRTITIPFNRF